MCRTSDTRVSGTYHALARITSLDTHVSGIVSHCAALGHVERAYRSVSRCITYVSLLADTYDTHAGAVIRADTNVIRIR